MEYLFKSILCLLVLLLFHRLVLQQEVLHRFNRFFLLAAIIGSFLIPLVTIEMEREIAVQSIPSVFNPAELISLESSIPNESAITPISKAESAPAMLAIPWSKLGWTIYVLGVAFFLIRFIRNISLIYDQIRKNDQVMYRQEMIVLLPESVSPFSFFKYIFYSKSAFEKEGIPDAVFLHEQCHVREKHTLDIVLVELLLIIFWFHPGLYLARQAIRLNHEFIADDQVIKQFSFREYQKILLSVLSSQQGFALGSSFNFPLTKKRFEMMNKSSKPGIKFLKLASLVVFLGVVVAIFADKVAVNAVAQQTEVTEKVQSTTSDSDLVKKYSQLYGKFQLKAFANRQFSIPTNQEIEALRMESNALDQLYTQMSPEERGKVKRVSFPYAKLEVAGKVTYKRFEDLTQKERESLGC
jgi:hypothetical protein